MTDTYLEKKTQDYQEKLTKAIESIETNEEENASEFLDMASSYLRDGDHFKENNNYPDALAAYSYGHAWLDAGMRLGYFTSSKEELFAADI